MATDGPDPTPCDHDVFTNGTCVLLTHSIPSNAMENWVKSVAEDSGQRVDWHFAGGRARVLAIGDLEKVKQSLLKMRPELDLVYAAEANKYADVLSERELQMIFRGPAPWLM